MDSCCEECLGFCCAGCCVTCFSALSNWCNTQAMGGNCCRGSRGCCDSCCRSSFDKDNFEDEVHKDMERTKNKDTQPGATQPMEMSAPAPATAAS
ncbi:hypothetical protein PM082_009055 [Marasmius tenuissimus]|nr:hypothetical protein PM082_009055 [Marasmius tenuissimus]